MISTLWLSVQLKSEGHIKGDIRTKKETTKWLKTPLHTGISGYSFNKELISVLFIFAKRNNVPSYLTPILLLYKKRLNRFSRHIGAAIGVIRLPFFCVAS